MGAAVGGCLVGRGHRVVSPCAERSAETRSRAAAAGIEDVGTLAKALQAAEIVLSVCPPHGAMELAREVAGRNFRGIYVDGNAVSPDSARAIGRVVEAGGASFIDGGIVGPPPGNGVRVWLYLCGARAGDIAECFTGSDVVAEVLGAHLGAASALKMCFAAWSKGSTALLGAIRSLAQHEGVDAALLAEWAHSAPDLPKRSQNIATSAYKAWRYVGEMEEIAASFAAAGLPDGFHLAAAEIYRRLEGFKSATKPPAISEVTAALAARAKH
ncbi:MAG: NAD(P)-dependent oxidoreductase [Betaproteobacteria bacterium]|nr:NAD(P)-dependent oxidoreductase [Betaproteobacteria bacterium]